MNKKIFTLLASSLMLFMTVFSTNAQSSHWIGDTVQSLPKGVGKGAYHLLVTYKGANHLQPTTGPGSRQVLAMDSFGYVGFKDSSYIRMNYENLREALWCVNVDDEVLGQAPTYTFTNKEYSMDLAVTDQKSTFRPAPVSWTTAAPPATGFRIQRQFIVDPAYSLGHSENVYSSGDQADWWFSSVYNSALETNQFLRIEIKGEADYFLTLATDVTISADSIFLVKVHKNDFNPGTNFYDEHLVLFTLVNAAPRVLTAKDFNTRLYEASEGYQTLTWSPDVSANQKNVFAQPLKATNVSGSTTGTASHYLYLQNQDSKYLYVDNEYYSALGREYPIIKDDAAALVSTGVDEFRLVYYPSADSLVINAREVVHAGGIGLVSDPLTYGLGQDGLYNWQIWDYLIVRKQDLGSGSTDRVITVYDEPANTRASFGISNCLTVDPNRTTLDPNLYTVRDTKGRYLVVPLVAGDFTPQWIEMNVDSYGGGRDTLEKVLKTPSYQWFITKVHEDDSTKTSRIYLTNREFDFIRLEYVQVYKTAQKFYATWSFLSDSLNPGATYVVNGTANVSVDGYQVVYDDAKAAAKKAELVAKYGIKPVGTPNHTVPAWMAYMPQDLMEKLYRTGPFLGYKAILPDTLNYYGYSFNFLNKMSTGDWYFGVTEQTNANNKDTSLYVAKDRTFFELTLPDTLRAYGREKYGVGQGINSVYQKYSQTKDIAPLERYYYYFMINDYYKYTWNDNYLVIDDAGRYAYTKEANANARKLNKAKFYMRFTNEKNATEYYTLMDRIDKSNFNYMNSILHLQITDTLKAFDASHGGITQKAFGVVMAYVNDLNNYVEAKVKTGSGVVSTFSLAQMQDELYRRFNTGLEECGRGEKADEPRTLKFYRYNNPVDFVYENQHDVNSVPKSGINFMGIENETECNPANGQWHNQHNYAIYVDTAYVNRGTGWIKPQYLLVVDPQIEKGGMGCNSCGDSIDFRPYVYGRYLRNETDSARVGGVPNGKILNEKYLWDGWERLAFTEAIHAGDSLYILNGTPITALYSKDKDNKEYLNFLRVALYPNIEIVDLGNNFHKDEVFSMRFVVPQRDKMGNKIEGASKRFFIESETTNRDYTQGRMIAPNMGGWVKRQNFVPVISRGNFRDIKNLAEEWDVECASINEQPTDNGDVSTVKVTVVSGIGSVSILNAVGKKVVVTNVLGQTIAQLVLTSDDYPIQAPKGIILVAIEGQEPVKTIVK